MSFPLPLPMRRALDLANEAAAAGEVPVGAVVTHGEELFSKLSPDLAYKKCPKLKALFDKMLELAKEAGL